MPKSSSGRRTFAKTRKRHSAARVHATFDTRRLAGAATRVRANLRLATHRHTLRPSHERELEFWSVPRENIYPRKSGNAAFHERAGGEQACGPSSAARTGARGVAGGTGCAICRTGDHGPG